MEVAKQIQLTLKGFPGGILAAVVVAKNHRHRVGQTGDGFGEAQIAITEITHKQHRIGSEAFQQVRIGITPVTVQIPCDGKPKPGAQGCQGQ